MEPIVKYIVLLFVDGSTRVGVVDAASLDDGVEHLCVTYPNGSHDLIDTSDPIFDEIQLFDTLEDAATYAAEANHE